MKRLSLIARDSKIHGRDSLALLAVVLLVAGAPALSAQSTSPVDHRSTDDGAPGLQEVVVTAERKTENLQDVPISVQAFDERELAQGGIKDFRQLALRTPGVDISGSQPGSSTISIRGVVPIGGEPTTGLYLDDVPITGTGGAYTGSPEPLINDTARVEVLKGPQGTLYGDSSMGGAIKFISNRPDPTGYSGRVNVETASTRNAAESSFVSGTLNVPVINNTLAVRTSVSYREDGGYINDISPLTKLITYPDANRYIAAAGKVAVAFTPDDSLTIMPTLTYQHDFDADEPYSTPPVPIQGTHPSQLTTSFLLPFQNETYEREPSDDRMTLATLTVEKHFSAADLTSVTGYLKRQFFELTDVTPYALGAFQGSNLYNAFSDLLTPSYAHDSTRSLTQEIRLSSGDRPAALKWTAGLFFSTQSFRFYQPVVTPGLTRNLVAEFGPGTTLETLEPSALPNDTVFVGDTTHTIKEYAAFGEGSYNLTDALKITLGVRAFELREGLHRSAEGFFNGGFSSDHPPDVSFNGVDPRLIADYKITRDNLVYVSAAEGFRPGLVNVAIPLDVCKNDLSALHITAPPSGAKPDSLWNFELGSKNTLLDGRLRINSAVYQENWKDIQLSVGLPTCGFNFSANVGQARIRGAELSADVEPVAGLTLGASATYLSAVITRAVADVVYRTGDALPNTPRQWYTAYGDYEHPITADVQGFVRLDYQRRGDAVRNPSAQNTYSSYVYHGWDVANLNFGATVGPWTARLFVNNLFNKDPPIDYEVIWSAWRTSTLRPRTLGLNVGRTF